MPASLATTQISDVTHELTGWQSYFYDINGGHDYIPAHYDPTGGPQGRPAIWADDTMWTIDTPEQPHSILALIYYRIWGYDGPVDLTNATLRVRLRGEALRLHGAKCFFWVVSYTPKVTRWHFTHQPLPISQDGWGDVTEFSLSPAPELWHRSFSSDRHRPSTLAQTLRTCFSYGFSFVGFSSKVTGRFGLADFRITAPVDPGWPFAYNSRRDFAPTTWLTVSRAQQRQVPVHGQSGSRPTPLAAQALGLENDYLLFTQTQPSFAYLTYVRAEQTTGGRDLRNAIVLVRHNLDHFDPHGGQVAFFVEHAASNTRWVLWLPIERTEAVPWYGTLLNDERQWRRLSGQTPLNDLLAGTAGRGGYDYFGLMVVACAAEPTGHWELTQFSIGPAIEVG